MTPPAHPEPRIFSFPGSWELRPAKPDLPRRFVGIKRKARQESVSSTGCHRPGAHAPLAAVTRAVRHRTRVALPPFDETQANHSPHAVRCLGGREHLVRKAARVCTYKVPPDRYIIHGKHSNRAQRRSGSIRYLKNTIRHVTGP